MGLSKLMYEECKMNDDYNDNHYEIISYTKGYDKINIKSSLKNGGVLDLTGVILL